MERAEFAVVARQIFDECLTTLGEKGRDYADKTDAFEHLKQIAQDVNLPVQKVIHVFLMKHIRTILKGVSTTEPIGKRCIDAINYIVLLHAWQDAMLADPSTTEE